jgi:hypothetical protein
MAFKSQLAGLVARQVGALQAKIVIQVQDRVLEAISKFSNQCPPSAELKKIIKVRNNLLNAINAVERRISSFRSVANKLDASIRTAKVAIEFIKRIPKPTVLTFVPGQSGGLVRGVPYSALTRLSDRLIQLNKLLDAVEADKAAVIGITSSAAATLSNLKNRLTAIDSLIQSCIDKSPDDAQEITFEAQPPQNTGSEGIPSDEYTYKGYTLEIVQDPNSPAIAPRRYAIAKDRVGVIVLYGPSSFSSDTKVLLDEIKFRIDNQLP